MDVHTQSLTFSKDMSNEQVALWLRNHPSLSGTNYEEDIGKLRGTLPDTMLIRGEPERAPNTRGTGSGFICMYIYNNIIYIYNIIYYVCGVIISVRRELNFEHVR